jgi:hypothetical protein
LIINDLPGNWIMKNVSVLNAGEQQGDGLWWGDTGQGSIISASHAGETYEQRGLDD